MDYKNIVNIIDEKISPYKLNEKGVSEISRLAREYGCDLLLECIDIGVATYLKYNEDDKVIEDSVTMFLQKLGGIAYNKSKHPIDQEISRLKNKCKRLYNYCDECETYEILHTYIMELTNAGYDDNQILEDLRIEVNRLCNSSHNWFEWSNGMQRWIEDIRSWENIEIKQNGTILPTTLFSDLSSNLRHLCEQINASYENNLYDCTSVMMRRLLEGLLVLSYQNYNIESEIASKDGVHNFTLGKIIQNAVNNQTLKLSSNVKQELYLFKDLGNYSAHKIWYNCTKQDIEPHILKYRVIIEELLYKSGLKT